MKLWCTIVKRHRKQDFYYKLFEITTVLFKASFSPQLPRPEEVGNGTYTNNTVTYKENGVEKKIEFYAEVETVLELKRTFDTTGQFYHVVLESQNMYNAEDRVEMEWEVRKHILLPMLLTIVVKALCY